MSSFDSGESLFYSSQNFKPFYRANPKNFIFPYINWIGNEIPVENVSIFVPPRESGDKSSPLNTKRSVNRLTKEEGTTENIYENTHTVWISRIV